jgi:hypothetical protein
MADNRITFTDFAKATAPDGSIDDVVESLNQLSPVLQDAHVEAANDTYGNVSTLRTALPTVGTAKINKGVARSKSITSQVRDPMGFFSGRSEVDARMRKVEGDARFGARRRIEDTGFEEALAQAVTNSWFYGSTAVDEAGFDGLAPRMAALNAGASLTGSQVWSHATGQAVVGSDGCSIFIVDHGPSGAKLIVPPNTAAGLDVKDLGEISVNDVDGNPFQAAVTLYEWFVGLAVKDPRHVARLANIDVSDAGIDTPLQGKIFDNIEKILSFMPEPNGHNRVLYCPLKLYSGFLKQARSVSNLALSMGEYLGKPTPMMWGYPLRRSDQLSVTEATVS